MRPQDDERRRARARLLGPLGVGLAFYALAALSLALTRGLDSIAAIWPCNGVLLAGLLLAPRRDAWRYAVAGAAASLAANLHAGSTLPLSAAFTAANVAEALLAFWLLRRRGRGVPSFVDPRDVGRFCVAVGAASLGGAALSATLSGSLTPAFAAAFFTADLLGLLIVTPIALVWADLIATWDDEGTVRPTPLAAALVLAGVAGVATLTFAQSTLPILFLPLAALLAATWRLGPLGATASVLLIALVGSVLTGLGRGPVGFVQGGDKAALYFFQFYLLVLLASALPLAALLAARDRLHRTLAEAHRMLAMAERAAEAGHWRIDVRRREVFWSEGAARIYGRAADAPPSFEGAIDGYHPDDREAVATAVARSSATGEPLRVPGARPAPRRQPPPRRRPRLGRAGTPGRGPRPLRGRAGRDGARGGAARGRGRGRGRRAPRRHRRAHGPAQPPQVSSASSTPRWPRPARPWPWPCSTSTTSRPSTTCWGHAAGDEVLRRVARTAEGALRAGDAIGRLGGEEFALLLPGADADGALAVAERVRAAIEASWSGRPDDPKVTVSVGVAAGRGPGRGRPPRPRRPGALRGQARRAQPAQAGRLTGAPAPPAARSRS
jgi:integral membrane sensor domain MASE1